MANVKANDVARLAGVEPSTVSRVLNRSFSQHRYAPRTIRRIHAAARKLGYQPSQAARTLRTGKSLLVGMVVSDISNPFFAQLAADSERFARGYGYHLIVTNTQDRAKWQAEHIRDLVSRGVDGLIVSPSGPGGLSTAAKMGVPVVLVDRATGKGNWPLVCLDHIKAGQFLGKHLSRLGYRQIGVVLPKVPTDPTLKQRLEGFQCGLGSSGKISWILRVPPGPDMQNHARSGVHRRLKASRPPDAIVGLNNTCTLGSVEALADLGITWGNSVGLAGIDDFPAASLLRPAVTVVAQPIEQIAANAVRLLVDNMTAEKPRARRKTVLLKPIFVTRDSLRKKA